MCCTSNDGGGSDVMCCTSNDGGGSDVMCCTSNDGGVVTLCVALVMMVV